MKTRSTCSRWRRLRISSQSRHSARTVRTKRSATAFAFGARTRCADDLDPVALEDGVEVARELAVTIPDQEANRCRALRQSPGELSGLLCHPGAARVRRTAA